MPRFKQLRIIGKRVRVLWDQDMAEDDYGEFTPSPPTIKVSRGLAHDDERETLLHEVAHAVEMQMNLSLPESAVRQLSIGFFAAMRDNPKMMAYLMEEEAVSDE